MAFWCKGGIPSAVAAGSGTIQLAITSLADGWSYYEGKFTPTNNSTTGVAQVSGIVPGINCYIDEFRIFPADAMMTTWTYEPMFGKSTQSDAAGRITRYEYDKFGKLSLTRDQDGNILSKYTYSINQ